VYNVLSASAFVHGSAGLVGAEWLAGAQRRGPASPLCTWWSAWAAVAVGPCTKRTDRFARRGSLRSERWTDRFARRGGRRLAPSGVCPRLTVLSRAEPPPLCMGQLVSLEGSGWLVHKGAGLLRLCARDGRPGRRFAVGPCAKRTDRFAPSGGRIASPGAVVGAWPQVAYVFGSPCCLGPAPPPLCMGQPVSLERSGWLVHKGAGPLRLCAWVSRTRWRGVAGWCTKVRACFALATARGRFRLCARASRTRWSGRAGWCTKARDRANRQPDPTLGVAGWCTKAAGVDRLVMRRLDRERCTDG
jgi:hypothetical protein